MTTNFEQEDGTTRDDLVQRVALMEAMIAEGRQSTALFGWVFVMWGLLYFVAMLWAVYLPFKIWAWPVCVAIGIFVGVVKGRWKRTDGASESHRARSIGAVWQVMCVAIILYAVAAGGSYQGNESAFIAPFLFFVGMAHGISARILRWGAQGLVAAVWWAGGMAMFFFRTRNEILAIFLLASFFGLILFGLYMMWLERRGAATLGQANA